MSHSRRPTAEWRQKYVSRARPADPLVSPGTEIVEHAIPFRRTFLRFVKGIICLGLPYLFESRGTEGWSSTRPTDEEDQGGTKFPTSEDPGLRNSQVLVVSGMAPHLLDSTDILLI